MLDHEVTRREGKGSYADMLSRQISNSCYHLEGYDVPISRGDRVSLESGAMSKNSCSFANCGIKSVKAPSDHFSYDTDVAIIALTWQLRRNPNFEGIPALKEFQIRRNSNIGATCIVEQCGLCDASQEDSSFLRSPTVGALAPVRSNFCHHFLACILPVSLYRTTGAS